MMKSGDLVKIEDIGTPATCIEVRNGRMLLELGGERFWIINTLCHLLTDMEEMEEAA